MSLTADSIPAFVRNFTYFTAAVDGIGDQRPDWRHREQADDCIHHSVSTFRRLALARHAKGMFSTRNRPTHAFGHAPGAPVGQKSSGAARFASVRTAWVSQAPLRSAPLRSALSSSSLARSSLAYQRSAPTSRRVHQYCAAQVRFAGALDGIQGGLGVRDEPFRIAGPRARRPRRCWRSPARPAAGSDKLASIAAVARAAVWVSAGSELPNRDLLAVRPSLPQIVLHLLLQPAFRAAAECL